MIMITYDITILLGNIEAKHVQLFSIDMAIN